MTEERKTRPRHKKIIEYWLSDDGLKRYREHVDKGCRLDFIGRLIIPDDFKSIEPFCFACKDMKANRSKGWGHFDRAHIIPKMLGGSNDPSNFIMLCQKCHLENPNTKHEDIYFIWLGSVKNHNLKWSEDLVNAFKLFGLSDEELEILNDIDIIRPMIRDATEEAGLHHGINVMTMAGLMTIKIKKYLKELKEDTTESTCDQMELF
jgi:hypothetical protein